MVTVATSAATEPLRGLAVLERLTIDSIWATTSSSSRLLCWYLSTASCSSVSQLPGRQFRQTHGVLPLPLVPLLFCAGDLALKVLGLDVDLAQPKCVSIPRVGVRDKEGEDALLRRLLEVLLGLVELLLQQLNLTSEVLAGSAVRLALGRQRLELLDLLLGLLNLALRDGQLVLQRSDLLLPL